MEQLRIIALATVTTFGLQISLAAQSSATRTVNKSFAGSWEGRMNELPGIELKLYEAEGKLSGVIVFHLQQRDAPDGRWQLAGEDRAALLTPRIEGDAFNFEVQHHKCHDCDELGPNVKFRMELSGTDEARLWKLGDEGKPSGTELKLERRSDSLAFAGAWEGKRDNRAGLDLKIEGADGKINGTALLYFQVGPVLPLLSPRAEGNTLTFEIQRRKCTQCDEPDANSKFLVQLTGPNEASLWMRADGEIDTHRAPDVKLVRHADSASWHDPSAHHVQFVVVEYGVRIEVLDWGGTGRNVVLLAGSGNTGHVFDDFAAKLNSFCHVYAITRRGYGESSHPDAGYTEERLAEDVLQVLDSLKIVAPIVAGHSAGGGELTRLGDEHSDRIAGLVYLDAAFDPADFPAANPTYMALFHNLPETLRNRPQQAATDKTSFRAYRDCRVRNGEVNVPESELHNQFATNSDGSVGAYKATTPFIQEAFGNGALKRDYSGIRVPILAVFAVAAKNSYEPKNAQERAATEAFDTATKGYGLRWKKNLQSARGGVRIIDLADANHYVFISNEAEVLRETRTFVEGLH